MGCAGSVPNTHPDEVSLARSKQSGEEIVSPKKLGLNKELLEKKMQLEYYYGCGGGVPGMNLGYSATAENVVYFAGKLCIVHDKTTTKSRYLGTNEDFSFAQGHNSNIEAMAISLDRQSVATAASSHTTTPQICIWKLETGELVSQFTSPSNITSLAFNKTSKFLILCDTKSNVYIFDTNGIQLAFQKSDDPSFSSAYVTASPTEQESFATIYLDGVIFWTFSDSSLKKLKKKAIHGPDSMASVCYSPDGICFSASCRGVIHIWKDKEVLRTVPINHIFTIQKIVCDKSKIYVGGAKGIAICDLNFSQQSLISTNSEVVDIDAFQGRAIVGLKSLVVMEVDEKNQTVIIAENKG